MPLSMRASLSPAVSWLWCVARPREQNLPGSARVTSPELAHGSCMPLTGEGADLVFTVLPGTQGIWIVDSDEGVGIMLVSPRDNRVRRIVRPNADLTDAAVVTVAPQSEPDSVAGRPFDVHQY
jgi:hypothetical protein